MKKVNFLLLLAAISWCTQLSSQSQNKRKVKRITRDIDQSITLTNTVNVNSPFLEFAPAIYQNGLVYVGQYKNGPIDEHTGETRHELFYAELDPNGTPSKPALFSLEIYSQFNEGPVTFNREGTRLYFTRNNMKNGSLTEGKEGRNYLKIYEAEKGYFDWEDIRELPFNSDDYSCMHPSLTPDGKKLFFASDMPDGYGGLDLYFVQKIRGEWSAPINLGPEVNTHKNEVFPFIHDSGILFFTSDGHKGFGGLDLFMIDISTNLWGDVLNLGQPFNTEEDDLSIVLNEEGIRGYFASSRPGGYGKDDLYMFTAPEGIRGRLLTKSVNQEIVVLDGDSGRPLSGAVVRAFERSPDGLIKNKDLYDLELRPSATSDDQLIFNLVRKEEHELNTPYSVTNDRGETLVRFVEGKDYLVMVSKSGYSTREITCMSEELMTNLQIELAPRNCLTLTGVVKDSKSLLPIPGAQVTIVNTCDNNQIELTSNMDGEFQDCLSMGCEFELIVSKDGYGEGHSSVSTVSIRSRRSASAEILLTRDGSAPRAYRQPLKKGTIIVLENIYYDFGKSDIRSGSVSDLVALIELMKKFPSVEIELGAHTDARGSEDFNLKLSLRRAESAKDFLVNRGIQQDRITAIGFGESRPRNNCVDGVDCTDEDYQYNRRMEVRVVHINEQMQPTFKSTGKR